MSNSRIRDTDFAVIIFIGALSVFILGLLAGVQISGQFPESWILRFAREVATEIIASIAVVFLVIIVVVVFAIAAIVSRRSRLIDFFGVSVEEPRITVYVSRHTAPTELPRIDTKHPDEPSIDEVLQRLREVETAEKSEDSGSLRLEPQEFEVVSAIEMIEFLHLKQFIEKPMIFDWLPPGDVQAWLDRLDPKYRRITVDFDVCPEDYEQIKEEGTVVFIGGPRANLGTYYFLYGEDAGIVRPKRLTRDKNTVESIVDEETLRTVGGEEVKLSTIRPDLETKNLGLIQRYKTNNRTIIYLAGSGINGTAAAVAYLRLNWKRLHDKCAGRNFAVIIECDRRREGDDPSTYLSKEWRETDWRVREPIVVPQMD